MLVSLYQIRSNTTASLAGIPGSSQVYPTYPAPTLKYFGKCLQTFHWCRLFMVEGGGGVGGGGMVDNTTHHSGQKS